MVSKVGKYTVEVGFEANKQELNQVNKEVEKSFDKISDKAKETLDDAVKDVKKTGKTVSKEVLDAYIKNIETAQKIETQRMITRMKHINMKQRNQEMRENISEQKRIREDRKHLLDIAKFKDKINEREEKKEEKKRKEKEKRIKNTISSIAHFSRRVLTGTSMVAGVSGIGLIGAGAVSAEKAYTTSRITGIESGRAKSLADVFAKRHINENLAYAAINAITQLRAGIKQGKALPNVFRALDLDIFKGDEIDVIREALKQLRTLPQFKKDVGYQAEALRTMGLTPELLKLSDVDFNLKTAITNTTKEVESLQDTINSLSKAFNDLKSGVISIHYIIKEGFIKNNFSDISYTSSTGENIKLQLPEDKVYKTQIGNIKIDSELKNLYRSMMLDNAYLRIMSLGLYKGKTKEELTQDFIRKAIDKGLINSASDLAINGGNVNNSKRIVNNITINGEPTSRQVNQTKNIINSGGNANSYEMTTQGVFN